MQEEVLEEKAWEDEPYNKKLGGGRKPWRMKSCKRKPGRGSLVGYIFAGGILGAGNLIGGTPGMRKLGGGIKDKESLE